nr:ABC transporter ATP-binding protein [Gammaproteobacteria bacterium]
MNNALTTDNTPTVAAATDTPAIHLSHVALTFPPAVEVIKDVNLTIPRGRHVALIGRSGSGKTSLLAIIGGLLKPSGGQVQTLGQPINDLDEDQLALLRRDNIGVVFQHFHLLETMTALENTALPLELGGHPNALARAKEMLAAVGLTNRMSHFPAQLSGGEQQRVAIARAFVSTPPLLLADEPTGNLDDDTSEQVLHMLLDIGKQNN